MAANDEIPCWQDTAGGVRLKVRAHAGARRNAIVGVHNGALKIDTTTAPERGKANRAIAQIIAEQCGVSGASVQLLSGETSSDKSFFIAGITTAQIAEKMSNLIVKLNK